MSEETYDVEEHLEHVEGSPVAATYTPRIYAREDAIKIIMNLLGIFDGKEAVLSIDGKTYLKVKKK